MVGVPPYERDVNTVFQDYALFPHMSVAENVAYGLRSGRCPRASGRTACAQALELVRLPGLGERRPAQLSGGQRQRVALARALVNRPRVLLLDEPLGALDLKLRQEMQVELRALQRQVGITFLYVTHDQEEALSMSDRLAVFRDGRIEQVGTPAEVYERPAHRLRGRVRGRLEPAGRRGSRARPPAQRRRVPGAAGEDPAAARGEAASRRMPCSVEGRIADAIYLGPFTRYRVTLDAAGELAVVDQNRDAGADGGSRALRGRRVRLVWKRASNRPRGGSA